MQQPQTDQPRRSSTPQQDQTPWGPLFDARALHRRVDKERQIRGKTWIDVSRETRVNPGTLGRMEAEGWPPSATKLVRLLLWLGDTDIQPYIVEVARP